jgi:hypothetical protein
VSTATINQRKINVRSFGTSIAKGVNALPAHLMRGLQRRFGTSRTYTQPFMVETNLSGGTWRGQGYSGLYTLRARAQGGDTMTVVVPAGYRELHVFYSKQGDGGTCTVTRQQGADTPVALTAIDCNATTASVGNRITYTIPDSAKPSTFVFTPPASGTYAYMEYYVADAKDFGISIVNAATTGSGLGNHTGSFARVPQGGQHDSAGAAPANGGLIAVVNPAQADVRPDLVIYSGPARGAQQSAAQFTVDLRTMVEMCVAADIPMVLIIDPMPGAMDTNDTTRANWASARNIFFTLRDENPDHVYVFDFDKFLSKTLVYSTKFHNPADTFNPADNGYGDPFSSAAAELCQRFGLPFPRYLSREPEAGYAAYYEQPTEPTRPSPGARWVDTSNPTHKITKEFLGRIADYAGKNSLYPGQGRGVWQDISGMGRVVHRMAYNSPRLAGTPWTETTNMFGESAIAHTTNQVDMELPFTKLKKGWTYTFSFMADFGTVDGDVQPMQASIVIGGYLGGAGVQRHMAVDPRSGTFVEYDRSFYELAMQADLLGVGDVRRVSVTFKMPTQAEIDTAVANGMGGASVMGIRFYAANGSAVLPLWDMKLELGASVTTGQHGRQGLVADDPTTATDITLNADSELVVTDNASANNVIVPTDAAVPDMPRFKPITIWQRGNGLTTFAPQTGDVTIRKQEDLTLVSAGRDSIMTLMKVGDNLWLLNGHLELVA